MNFYIAHILNPSFDEIHLYNTADKDNAKKTLKSLRDLEKINDVELLLVLIPASEVTSYEFKKNESLSDQINIANFISDIDSNFIDSVSDNEYFLGNGAAYAVNKIFLDNLNQYLSNLNCKVCISPEYLINSNDNFDVITEVEDKFMFAYKNNCGFSINKTNLNQYLDLVVNNKPNFNPKIFSSNEALTKRFKSDIDNHKFHFTDIKSEIVNSIPNFFKVNMSIGFIIKKINFSRAQLLTTILALLFLIVGSNFLTYRNVKNTEIYNKATFNIFTSISNDINKVISPRNQIDQILKNIPEKSNQGDIELPNLELFFKYGEKYISDISVDILNSTAEIKINSMPAFQFNILKTSAEKLNISISDNDIKIKDGSVDGVLTLRYEDV